MLAGSELVFEGRAIDRHVVEGADVQGTRTCIRFEVLEVVTGPPVASPLELCFAGGRSAQGATRLVAGVHMPAPGEHGIYFVSSLEEPRISPLEGWDQGHFVVAPRGAEVVTTVDGRPVVGLDSGAGTVAEGPSAGVARGARVAEPGARSAEAPLDAAAFKARLRDLLAEGR